MGICCTTAFLVGAICGCWPCFLPCCIFLPLIPYPIVVVRVPKRKEEENCSDDENDNKPKQEKEEEKSEEKNKERFSSLSREGSIASQKRDSQLTDVTGLDRRESKVSYGKGEIINDNDKTKKEENVPGDPCFKEGSKCYKIEKSSTCHGKGCCKGKNTDTNKNGQVSLLPPCCRDTGSTLDKKGLGIFYCTGPVQIARRSKLHIVFDRPI